MVARLQAELQSCRDQMGVHGQVVAAMAAERDACRASADESADRAKVRLLHFCWQPSSGQLSMQ